jgi:hypothetical protein
MADRGIDFAGDGAQDVGSRSLNTQPSASKSGSGPIDFAGDGEMDCSGVMTTNDPKGGVPGGCEIEFVAN